MSGARRRARASGAAPDPVPGGALHQRTLPGDKHGSLDVDALIDALVAPLVGERPSPRR